MKICIAIDHMRPGGAQNVLLYLATGLVEHGHDVNVLCFGPADSYEFSLADAGVPLTVLDLPRFNLIRSVKELRTHLDEHGPDILQTFLPKADMISRIATSRGAGQPRLVSSLQWGSGSHKWWHSPAYKLTAGSCDFTVPVSENGHELATGRLGVAVDKVQVIRNAVNLDRFESMPDRNALRAELGIPIDAFAVVAVGRLAPVKSYDVLIDGFAEFAERVPTAMLIIAGDGELRESLTKHAVRSGKQVVLAGYKKDGWRYAAAADVFVNTSKSEGSSNAVIEAMTQGTPVIATDVPGNNEIVLDEKTGLLVPWKNAGALAGALTRIEKDTGLAYRLGTEGRAFARERHSVKKMATGYESVYRKLLDYR